MTQDKPVVTILLAAYNGAPYLREQIDSILAQAYDNLKLVLSGRRLTGRHA